LHAKNCHVAGNCFRSGSTSTYVWSSARHYRSLVVTPLYCKHEYRYTWSGVDLSELVKVVFGGRASSIPPPKNKQTSSKHEMENNENLLYSRNERFYVQQMALMYNHTNRSRSLVVTPLYCKKQYG
jgi:hypothetical protein